MIWEGRAGLVTCPYSYGKVSRISFGLSFFLFVNKQTSINAKKEVLE